MARPTLFTAIKFRRLVHRLGVPVPHVVGYLECLWSVAYECGEPAVGDALDVELAAQWPGEPGVLAAALVETGFVDDVAGVLTIHDLWDHCPEYVKKRRERELGRQRRGEELAAEQQKKPPRRRQRPTTADNGGQRQTVSDEKTETSPNGLTPAPAPAPAPHKHPPAPSGGVPGDLFEAFWRSYPRHVGKAAAVKAWERLAPDEALANHIIAAVKAQRKTPAWTKDGGQFVPHAATWLNGRRWEDEVATPDTPADTGFDERSGCYTRPRRLTPEEQAEKIAASAGDPVPEWLNQNPAETPGNATPESSAA